LDEMTIQNLSEYSVWDIFLIYSGSGAAHPKSLYISLVYILVK
jgi:hypothetical protein